MYLVLNHLSCLFCIKESKLELSICLNAVVESEFAQLLFASVSPDLSIVSDVEPCICPISIYESVFCHTSPVTTPETLSDLPVGSSSLVTAQAPAIELLTLPVTNSETINALYVCPVSTNEPDYKTVCPLSCHQGKYWWHPMFPALVLETIDALSVSCVSVFPRLQSLLWAPALSAPPWRSSATSVPPWCLLSCSVVSCSAVWILRPVCFAMVVLYSTRFAGSIMVPCFAGSASVPRSYTFTWTLPTVPPLFRLCSTTLLDCVMFWVSGSHSLGDGALSWIRSMDFHSLATRVHSSITLTFTPHRLLHITLDYISQQPFH